MRQRSKTPVSLAKWIWRAYLKTALIPVLLIELVFMGIFFSINIIMKDRLYNLLYSFSQSQLNRIVATVSDNIDNQLDSITISTELFAAQMGRALQTPAELDPADAARLQYSPDGAYYTTADTGGAAVFYSGSVPIGASEKQKVARILTTQDLMEDICRTNPLISSIYLETYDSLNVAFPYVDVTKQFAPQNAALLNFYYEADALHDPQRTSRWVNVHLDPGGRGWIATSIMPVYNGDFLEGVVGIDVVMQNISAQILKADIPGEGYDMLAGSDGTILALSDMGKAALGLKETDEQEAFNLYKLPATADFADKLMSAPSGFSMLTSGNENKIVSWSTIQQTGWKLIIVIPEKTVYEKINQVGDGIQKIGMVMSAGLILFFAFLLLMLNSRSKRMSENLSKPLVELNNIVQRIGDGQFFQRLPEFSVKELQESSVNIINMGIRLGEINSDLLSVQEELRDKESYLQAVISSIDDAIIELDENGVITNLIINDESVAPGARGITSIDSFFSKEKAEAMRVTLREVIRTGKPITIETEVENSLSFRWVQARVSLVSGNPARIVVTARDITKRKEMEEAILKARDDAEAASRAKSQFLSNMSHELRTPLNAVLGFAQVLDMDPSAPLTGMQKEYVCEIMKAGSHLLELINEVLDLARIEAGKARLSIEPVDISTVIEETMMMIIPISEKYSVKVSTDSATCSHKCIMADKIKLKQILINLLSNAIKYNKQDGKVEFYCQERDDKVLFHVVDTGIGIPEGELETIFRPFHRLNNTKHVVEGTGVGLAVVKQLTEMMGGCVRVESTEGVGSHFTVELPSAEEMTPWNEKTGLPEHTIKADGGITESKTILYIEDNQANLRLVERVLELMPNTTFLSALTAELGIDLAREKKPDLILLDINLPGMDGYEAFDKLQEYPETRNIPVIAVSSNAMEREIGRAIRMGFFDYITKPIKADVFFERIRRVFTREQK